jgi:hypothetical protein
MFNHTIPKRRLVDFHSLGVAKGVGFFSIATEITEFSKKNSLCTPLARPATAQRPRSVASGRTGVARRTPTRAGVRNAAQRPRGRSPRVGLC